MTILLDTVDFLWFVSGNSKRTLICQAQDKGMRLASSDPAMRPYAVTLL